jgi:hypothetical protein
MLTNVKITLLLEKLEISNGFNYNDAFNDPQTITNLSFTYAGVGYLINTVFLNDFFDLNTKSEMIDCHFYFNIGELKCELVYCEEENIFIIQSYNKAIKKAFKDNKFESFKPYIFSRKNYFFKLSETQIVFN